jgi:hypothetical protein
MIRPAVAADRARIVQLLADSRAAAGFDDPAGATGFSFPFNPDYAERLFLLHLRGPRTICIVHDVEGQAEGVLMATASEHPFGPVWLARETLWWIDPAHRGSAAFRMLDAYEAWASSQRCRFVGMAGMGNDPVVAKLYQRRGYRVAETHFLKALQTDA